MNKKFSSAENKMTHEDCKECLFGRKTLTKMNVLNSRAQNICTEIVKKSRSEL